MPCRNECRAEESIAREHQAVLVKRCRAQRATRGADPDRVRPAPNGGSGARRRGGVVEPLLHFSFITLTTLGYGDILPVHPAARSLAMFEAKH
ncbi:MAG TPA: potassium channel family protein [Candidatus Methylomirabilis sp.]|nr:potassium channel family protein [Candidatus Methylomirabilis sp.]